VILSLISQVIKRNRRNHLFLRKKKLNDGKKQKSLPKGGQEGKQKSKSKKADKPKLSKKPTKKTKNSQSSKLSSKPKQVKKTPKVRPKDSKKKKENSKESSQNQDSVTKAESEPLLAQTPGKRTRTKAFLLRDDAYDFGDGKVKRVVRKEKKVESSDDENLDIENDPHHEKKKDSRRPRKKKLDPESPKIEKDVPAQKPKPITEKWECPNGCGKKLLIDQTHFIDFHLTVCPMLPPEKERNDDYDDQNEKKENEEVEKDPKEEALEKLSGEKNKKFETSESSNESTHTEKTKRHSFCIYF